ARGAKSSNRSARSCGGMWKTRWQKRGQKRAGKQREQRRAAGGAAGRAPGPGNRRTASIVGTNRGAFCARARPGCPPAHGRRAAVGSQGKLRAEVSGRSVRVVRLGLRI